MVAKSAARTTVQKPLFMMIAQRKCQQTMVSTRASKSAIRSMSASLCRFASATFELKLVV